MTGMTTKERAYQALGASQALLRVNRFLQALPDTLTMQEALESVIAWVKLEANRLEGELQGIIAEVKAEQEVMV